MHPGRSDRARRLNLYGYVNGDPVNFSDPFVLFLCCNFPGEGGMVGKVVREVTRWPSSVVRSSIGSAWTSRSSATRQDASSSKGSRYILLKNEDNLVGDQRERLDALLAAKANLNLVYILKDQLKHIWTYWLPGWAQRALDQWCALAEASGLKPLPDLREESRAACRGDHQ